MDTSQKSPEREFLLQKYLLLHSVAATSPASSTSRTRFSSLSSSPDSNPSSSFSAPQPQPQPVTLPHRRSGSMSRHHQRPALRTRRSSLPTVFDESVLGEIEEDENRLKDVHLHIKSTLTELLNCESVRNDGKYRMWVQTRLMDAEQELKNSRTRSCERRRSEDVGGLMI